MKKLTICALALSALLATGCGNLGGLGTTGTTTTNSGASAIGSVLGSVLNGGALGNVISSVIGGTKLTQANLVGTWRYSGPGCAFTSDQLLAKAGGEVVAAQIKEKMLPTYQTLGFSSSNTVVTLQENGTFNATIDGKSFSGTYTYDESTSKVVMKATLLTLNCYAKKNSNGIALLFEASKLLTVLQTLSALSGNQSLQAIGEISKSYDGVRLGFDFTK